jgi:hypothetical protein
MTSGSCPRRPDAGAGPRRAGTGNVYSYQLSAAGEVLFRQGDPADWVYVVVSGLVELVQDGVLVSTAAAGDWFGEMGPLFSLPRSATAQAGATAAVVEPVTTRSCGPPRPATSVACSPAGAPTSPRVAHRACSPTVNGRPRWTWAVWPANPTRRLPYGEQTWPLSQARIRRSTSTHPLDPDHRGLVTAILTVVVPATTASALSATQYRIGGFSLAPARHEHAEHADELSTCRAAASSPSTRLARCVWATAAWRGRR